jgi:hypothetical protein
MFCGGDVGRCKLNLVIQKMYLVKRFRSGKITKNVNKYQS